MIGVHLPAIKRLFQFARVEQTYTSSIVQSIRQNECLMGGDLFWMISCDREEIGRSLT